MGEKMYIVKVKGSTEKVLELAKTLKGKVKMNITFTVNDPSALLSIVQEVAKLKVAVEFIPVSEAEREKPVEAKLAVTKKVERKEETLKLKEETAETPRKEEEEEPSFGEAVELDLGAQRRQIVK